MCPHPTLVGIPLRQVGGAPSLEKFWDSVLHCNLWHVIHIFPKSCDSGFQIILCIQSVSSGCLPSKIDRVIATTDTLFSRSGDWSLRVRARQTQCLVRTSCWLNLLCYYIGLRKSFVSFPLFQKAIIPL